MIGWFLVVALLLGSSAVSSPAYAQNPGLAIGLNKSTFEAGDQMIVTLNVSPGSAKNRADLYVMLQNPTGQARYLSSNGILVQNQTPYLRKWVVSSLAKQLYVTQVTPKDLPGPYKWGASLNQSRNNVLSSTATPFVIQPVDTSQSPPPPTPPPAPVTSGTHVPSWVAYYRWYDTTMQNDPGAQSEIDWVGKHYDLVALPTIGRNASAWPAALLKQANPNIDILWYLDVRGLWSNEEHLADLEMWCTVNGVNFEDMFLHAIQDISTPAGLIKGYNPSRSGATATSRDQARLYNDAELNYRGYMYQMNVGHPDYQRWYADYSMRLANSYGSVKTSGVMGDDAAYKLRWQQWWTLTTVAGTPAMLAIAEYQGYATPDAVDAAHVSALAALTQYVSSTMLANGYLFLPNYSATFISGFEPWKSAAASGVLYEGLASLSTNLNMWADSPEYNILGYIDEYTAAGKRSYLHVRSKLQDDSAHMSGYPTNFCTTGYQECLARERLFGLAAYYLMAGPGVYFNMTAANYSLDPQTDYWFGAEEVDLGAPLGARNPSWATGPDPTDPYGSTYRVYAREFEKGLVLFKPMPFYGSYGTDSATQHMLPAGTWYVLNADGTKAASPVAQVTLRNAESVILLKGP